MANKDYENALTSIRQLLAYSGSSKQLRVEHIKLLIELGRSSEINAQFIEIQKICKAPDLYYLKGLYFYSEGTMYFNNEIL